MWTPGDRVVNENMPSLPLSEVSITSLERPIRPALISGFCSMKRLGVFLLPGWDASPSQGYPQHFRRYPFIHLGGERHRESSVLPKNTTQCPRPGHFKSEPRPLDLESSTLTMRPPRLTNIYTGIHCILMNRAVNASKFLT